ncbi:MAG: hypothetical protein AAGK09_10820 [Planctomycetota bacterium]
MSDPRDIYELADEDESLDRSLRDRVDPDTLPEVRGEGSLNAGGVYEVEDHEAELAAAAARAAAPSPEVAASTGPAYELAEPEPPPAAGVTGGAGGRPVAKGALPQRPTSREPLVRDGPIFADADRYCLDCGYNLRGLHEPRCPECGSWFDPERPSTYYAKGDVSQELLRQDKTIRTALIAVLIVLTVAGLPIIYFADDLLGPPFEWLGPLLTVTPWSAMCAYALIWLIEHDRVVTLPAYLIAGVVIGVGLGIVAALVGCLATLIGAGAFSFELGYVLLGGMGGVFAAFVRRYNTLSAI